MSDVTCRELIGFLDDYVAGELPPPRVSEFERHLSECPPCVAYVKSYRDTIRLARAAADAPAAEDIPADVLTVLLAAIGRNTNH